MALFYSDNIQTGTVRQDLVKDIVLDAQGAIYIAGTTQGSLPGFTNAGQDDVWFVKYTKDANGKLIADPDVVGQVGSSRIDRLGGIGIRNNQLVLVRTTYDDLDKGGADIWLATYDTITGAVIVNPTNEIVNPTNGEALNTSNNDVVTDVVVTADATYLTGTISDNTDSGIFVAKLTANNTVTYKQELNSGFNEVANAIAVDADGNVYITGYTQGNLAGNTNQGSLDAFVAKYNADGTFDWVKMFGTSGREEGKDLAIDSEGNVIVVGYTSGSLFGANQGQWDAFVLKLDSNGNRVKSTQFGTGGNEFASGIAISQAVPDAQDPTIIYGEERYYVTGTTLGILANDPSLDSPAQKDDIWLKEYDSNLGNSVTRQFGSNAADGGVAIAVNNEDPDIGQDSEVFVDYNIYAVGNTLGATVNGESNQGFSDTALLYYTTEQPADGGVVTKPTDPTLDINAVSLTIPIRTDGSSRFQASPGETFEVPLTLNNAKGVRSLDFDIDYDPSFLVVEDVILTTPTDSTVNNEERFTVADLNWSLTYNVTADSLKVNLFNDDGPDVLDLIKDDISGEVAKVVFRVSDGALLTSEDDNSPLTLNNVRINEESANSAEQRSNFDSIANYVALQADPVSGNEVEFFANGFSFALNRSIDLTQLSYDAVVVRDADNNIIPGSIFWDGDENRVTFVKYTLSNGFNSTNFTEESFTPGEQYSIELISAGFVTPLGATLDGDNDGVAGGNYNTTFTVDNYDRIFSIDSTSRGPNQPLAFPNDAFDNADQETLGTTPFAVSIDDMTGISKIELTLNYDPAVLRHENTNSLLADGFNLEFGSLTNTNWILNTNLTTPGVAKATLTLAPNAVATGGGDILNINAQVRGDAAYGGSQLFELSDVKLYDAAGAELNENIGLGKGFLQTTYLGDATGGEFHESGDASIIARLGVGLDTVIESAPLVYPNLIADVSRDGTVSAFDASIVSREGLDINEAVLPDIPGISFDV